MADIDAGDEVGLRVTEAGIVVHAWPNEDAWRAHERPTLLIGGNPSDLIVVFRDGRLMGVERIEPGDQVVAVPTGA